MANTQWKVYGPARDLIATFKYAESAAEFLLGRVRVWQIRYGPRGYVLWNSAKDDTSQHNHNPIALTVLLGQRVREAYARRDARRKAQEEAQG